MIRHKLFLVIMGSIVVLSMASVGCTPDGISITNSPGTHSVQKMEYPITAPNATTEITTTTVTPQISPPIIGGMPRFSAIDFFDQWGINPYAADANYKGKPIEVVGVLGRFFEPGTCGYNSFTPGFGFAIPVRDKAINCYFDSAAQLLPLLKGQTVIVQGICQSIGFYGFPVITSCSIVSE
jgi:hypothetical protein